MRLRTGCPTPLLCAALLAVSVWPAHADLTPSRPGLRPIAGSVQVAMSDLEAFGLIGDPTAFARPLGDADYLPKILAAMRDNDFSEAEILKSKLAAPAARAVAEWVAIRMGEPMSLERMIAFQRDNPEWPNSNLLKRRIEDALLASRKSPARIRAFFAERPPVTGAGRVALTFALKADGLDAQAADLARHVWREESFGPEIESKILDQFPDVITQADHRFRMERLLFKENWSAATRAASRAGKDYETLVKARMGLYQGGKKAEKAFAAVPAALRTDSSYIFSRVLFLRRKDKPAEAAQAMASAPRDPELLVDGDEWWAERRLIARKLLDKADAKAAYDVVSGHGAESPVQQIEAEFHSGWIALRFLKDPALAGKHFAQAANVASSPISVARAAYWQGRAAEAAGAAEDARHYYVRAADQPITYYGQLARQTLGIPVALRQPQALSEEARKAFEGRTSIQALRLLNQIGEQELAIGLSAELAQSLLDPGQLDVLAAIAEEDGNPRSMLAIGKTAVQRGFPLDRRAYPTAGIPTFSPVGDQVERAMVFAIARQESAFNPRAQSSAGARGLMQLMPATAKRTAQRFGMSFDIKRLIDDPAYNAKLGSAHLGELMQDWRGSHILAFASYNAGGGNVKKWIDAYGDPRKPQTDLVDWIERIPFYETRNYVQRVMENLVIYRQCLDGSVAAVNSVSTTPQAQY